jgi:uncharacterized membrane protein YgcG
VEDGFFTISPAVYSAPAVVVVPGCAVWFVVSGDEHPAIRRQAMRRRTRPGTQIVVLSIVIIGHGFLLIKMMRKMVCKRGYIHKSAQGNANRNARGRGVLSMLKTYVNGKNGKLSD